MRNLIGARRSHGMAVVPFLLLIAPVAAFAQETPDWGEVGALFGERCVMCHSGETPPLGLRLDSYDDAMAGSENGPVLVPGEPDASELVHRIRGESEPRMPLVGEPLSADEIAMIESWVSAGLPGEDGAEQQAQADEPADPQAEQRAQADAPAEPQSEQPAQADEPAAPDAAEPDSPALPGPGEPVTFAHVEPIFLQRCVMCHSDAAAQGPPEGLRLDSYENVVGGGERLVVLPGNPDSSEIVRRIEGTAQPRMPFNGPPWLSEDQIRLIRQWIAQGAPDAQGNEAPVPVGREVRVRGILTGEWAIDGVEFQVDAGTDIDDRPAVGQPAEMRGVVQEDGTIRATRFRDR